MKNWYRFANAAADPTVADIYIIDFIGGWMDEALRDWYGDGMTGVTAKQFVKDLAALPDAVRTIRVHINSPGGDVFGGLNIANALREQSVSKGRAVETIIDGLAASAASVIAMAGTTVRMSDNALLMIHNAWTIEIGNAAELRKTADTLDTIGETIVATYRWHSTLEPAAIAKLMDDETWMDASEALKGGFVTEVVQGLKAAASLRPAALAKLAVPEQFRDRVQAWIEPPPAPPAAPAAALEVLQSCTEAGCLDIAQALIEEKAPMAVVQNKVATEKTRRAEAKQRESAIRAVCKMAKLDDLADEYVAGGMSVDAVKAHMLKLQPRLDAAEIDGGLNPDRGGADVAAGWKSAMAKVGRRFGAASK